MHLVARPLHKPGLALPARKAPMWDLRKFTPSVRKGSLAGVRQWVSETRDWGQRLAGPSRFKPAAQRFKANGVTICSRPSLSLITILAVFRPAVSSLSRGIK